MPTAPNSSAIRRCVDVPVTRLTSKRYAAELRGRIDPERARPAQRDPRRRSGAAARATTPRTISVVDRFGNAVANTYTLNFSYGLGLVAEGTGILLNNELDDFAAKPGAPNAFGLVGGEANAPGPGKRPLSSMSPTIVLRNGKPFLVTGSPGGSRIITAVLQVIVNVIDRRHERSPRRSRAPRIHHQWLPDEVVRRARLRARAPSRAHRSWSHVREGLPPTSANSIMVAPDGLIGAADHRTRGALAAGH